MSLWTGCSQLLQSPSGVFALLVLICITIVTWHQPAVGGVAFAAFVGIIPAILAYCEHKEQMKQLNDQSIIPPPPIIPERGRI